MKRPYSETKKIILIAVVILTVIMLVKKFVFDIDTEGRPAGYTQKNDALTVAVIGVVSYVVSVVSNQLKLPKYRRGITGAFFKLRRHRLFSRVILVVSAFVAGWLSFILYGRLIDERLAIVPLVAWAIVVLFMKRKRKAIVLDVKQEMTHLRELKLIPPEEEVIALFQMKLIRELTEGEHVTILTNRHIWRIAAAESGWEVKVHLPLASIHRFKRVSGETQWLAFANRDEQEVYLDFELGAHPFMSKYEMKQRYNDFLEKLYHQLDCNM